jgi:hypothetical protein
MLFDLLPNLSANSKTAVGCFQLNLLNTRIALQVDYSATPEYLLQ